MTTALHILPTHLVASGVQRAVYLHPNDKTKLIKVLKRTAEMPLRSNFNGVIDRWFPSTRLRQIRKEYSEYLRIMLQHPEQNFHAPMSHMFGFVSTDLGLGCLTERVMNPDGSLGPTLDALVKGRKLDDTYIALLNDTVTRLYKNNIRASDMNPKNFVFGHRDSGGGLGPLECVLVDGFGDIHAIPVRSMASWSNRLGLDDSCKRLANNTRLTWNPKTRQFSR